MNAKLSTENSCAVIFPMRRLRRISMVLLLLILFCASAMRGNDLLIGTAEANITPDLPVALMGQFHLRIAHTVRTSLVANVVVLELRNGERSIEQTIFVSCDLVFIPAVLTQMVRKQVQQQIRNSM